MLSRDPAALLASLLLPLSCLLLMQVFQMQNLFQLCALMIIAVATAMDNNGLVPEEQMALEMDEDWMTFSVTHGKSQQNYWEI